MDTLLTDEEIKLVITEARKERFSDIWAWEALVVYAVSKAQETKTKRMLVEQKCPRCNGTGYDPRPPGKYKCPAERCLKCGGAGLVTSDSKGKEMKGGEGWIPY